MSKRDKVPTVAFLQSQLQAYRDSACLVDRVLADERAASQRVQLAHKQEVGGLWLKIDALNAKVRSERRTTRRLKAAAEPKTAKSLYEVLGLPANFKSSPIWDRPPSAQLTPSTHLPVHLL